MSRKALGRGLSALLSDTAARQEETQQALELELEIDLIIANPNQPRTRFDEIRLDELAQSIRANGIVQPILVRHYRSETNRSETNNQETRYQIVAGERRWRAAQLAGLTKIPAIVRDIPDDKLLELALIENIQRHELNAIEEALAYKGLLETLQITQEVLAERLGRGRSHITNHIRLLRLPEEVQRLVVEDRISMGHARALLAVEDSEIQRNVARRIVGKSLSVRETERAIRRILNGETATSDYSYSEADELASELPPPPVALEEEKDANVRAAETKLRRQLSTQVRIVANRNGVGGKFEIEYYDADDLQRVYQILLGQAQAQAQVQSTAISS